MVDFLTVLSGFAVGMLVGLTGVGGGSLMTPILVLLFGRHVTTAIGTDLLYAAVTKSAGSFVHGFRGSVDWRVTARLATGSLPAAILTIVSLHELGIGGRSSPRLLTVSLGLALVLSASGVLTLRRLTRMTRRQQAIEPGWVPPITVLAGLVLGVLVTLTSVGAGALGMMMLVLLYPNRPVPHLVGSDIAHAVPLTLIAGLGHWLLGSVDWMLMLTLLVGSIPGIVIGSYLSGYIPERVLRPILAATLALAGVRLMFG
jgi:uncharacterized membrane protein YfcA